jgi:phage shock protein PspC (stress-responsive transcriptional regulator)
MNKVVSMNLNGNAYQLDEPGYAALSVYLASAKARLADNPDQGEILADLEQAIADKLQRFLSAHKSVVTETEVGTVIHEMGPVEGDAESQEGTQSTAGPKRLYRIPEGELIGGVATGLASYLQVSVWIVRVVMILLLLITSGGFAFAYLLALVFVPVANTQEKRAKAEGIPFNAEEIISRTKEAVHKGHAEGMKHWKEWKHHGRSERKAYKKAYKQAYASYDWRQGRHRSMLGELIGLTVFAFFIWLGYHHVPDIHSFLDSVWMLLQRVSDSIVQFVVSQQ